MSGKCDKCGEHTLGCRCKNDIGHHCKKGSFTCFRMIGDEELVLDSPKNMPVIVSCCPFCGYSVTPPSSNVTTLK